MINYNILLIEDDFEDAFLIKEYLDNFENGEKFEIDHFTSVQEGIESVKNKSYDIILSDLNLPDSIGLDTVKSIMKVSMEVPVIVLTGNNDERTGLQALELGAQDYLVKGQHDDLQLIHSIKYSIKRKKNEYELRRSKDLLTAVFDNSSQILFLVDQNTEIVKINRKGLQVLDTNEREVTGLRPGNALNCINHFNNPDGCGFGEKCKLCEPRNLVIKTFNTKESICIYFYTFRSSCSIITFFSCY